jgi:hypothetical protein
MSRIATLAAIVATVGCVIVGAGPSERPARVADTVSDTVYLITHPTNGLPPCC